MEDVVLEPSKNHAVDGLDIVALRELLAGYFLQLAETV